MIGPYLAEVEQAFLVRAGRGLMLSAADVELVRQWHRSGAPAYVVQAGIEAAFERPGVVPGRVRRLAFARRAVEDAIAAWRSRTAGTFVDPGEAPAGAAPDGGLGRFPADGGGGGGHAPGVASGAGPGAEPQPAGRRLARLLAERRSRVAEALLPVAEAVAARVAALDPGLGAVELALRLAPLLIWAEDAAWTALSGDARAEIEADLERLLAGERRRTDPVHFAETWDAWRRRALRARLGLPEVQDIAAGSW